MPTYHHYPMFSSIFRKFVSRHKKKLLYPSLLAVPTLSNVKQSKIDEKDDKELLQVYWVIRHGWRTPISMHTFHHLEGLDWECYTKEETEEFRDRYLTFHKDGELANKFEPFFHSEQEHIYGKCHKGQLTLLGQEQVFDVGKLARDIYVNKYKFLDPNFDTARDLYVRSTSTGRTVETAFQFAKGLSGSQLDKDGSKLRVHLYSYDKETMLARTSFCPKVHTSMRKKRRQSKLNQIEYIKEIFDAEALESQELYDKMLNSSVGELCNNLSILRAHDLPIPRGIQDHHIEQVCALSGRYYSGLYNKKSLHVAIGGFIREINDTLFSKAKKDMSLKSSNYLPTDDSKFIIAAGHDTTLFPLLLSFGIFDGHHPPMSSSLGIELWKNKESTKNSIEDYSVKLMYNFKEIPIPECGNKLYCPLKEFLEIGDHQIEFEKECIIQE